MLQRGEPAPDFSLPDQHGRTICLRELVGPVVLYFYPEDFTPTCTKQACLFREAFPELQQYGATLIGVSADKPETHRMFGARHALPFSLLSDPARALAKSYRVMTLFGFWAKRATFVLDARKVVHESFWSEVSMQAHVDGARAALKTLPAL